MGSGARTRAERRAAPLGGTLFDRIAMTKGTAA